MGRSSVQRKKKKKRGRESPPMDLKFHCCYTFTQEGNSQFTTRSLVQAGTDTVKFPWLFLELAWLIQAFLTTSRESQCV